MVEFQRSRVVGAMFGLAIGNAQGAAAVSLRDATSRYEALTKGSWTDITASTYALGHSLIDRRLFDPNDVLLRMSEIAGQGAYCCAGRSLDIDLKTTQAIHLWKSTGRTFPEVGHEPAEPAALVRTLATVLFAGSDTELSAFLAAEQCRLTNPEPQTIEACVALAAALRSLLQNKENLTQIVDEYVDTDDRSLSASANAEEILVHAFHLAKQSTSFEEAIVSSAAATHSVLLSATVGLIAGAAYGLDNIPKTWLTPLRWKANLEGLARSLSSFGSTHSKMTTRSVQSPAMGR